MAKYRTKGIGSVGFILENYWLLKSGQLPFNSGVFTKGKGGTSPHETAICWISDVDTALSSLDQKHPERWSKLCTDITTAKLEVIVRFLNHWQQAIIRYYLLLGDESNEDEGKDARIAVKMMVRFLNQKGEK